MPVVVETNFHQQPTASLLSAAPVAVDNAGTLEVASIAMMEVASSSSAAPATARMGQSAFGFAGRDATANPVTFVGDSTFIGGSNGSSSAAVAVASELQPTSPKPVSAQRNGTLRDASRSPSVGDTFVSAAASSDQPYPSSFSDTTDDSDTGPDEEEEEAEMCDVSASRSAYGYITTATITVSDSHNSLDAKDVIDGRPNNQSASPGNINIPAVPLLSMASVPGTFVEPGVPPPGQAPSPAGSTSISISIGSAGEDSTMREQNEPHISVKVVPEKKGRFLKHSEYEIKLKGTEKPVRRRYKDFVTLHGYLAEKYPYRILPTLPPKQLMLDSLLEQRRRGLQTWLTIVSLHPVLGPSPIVGTFLRDATTDYQYRLRVAFEKQMDEYARLRPDVALPREDMDALGEARNRLRRVKCGIGRLKELFDDQWSHTEQQLTERTEMHRILQSADMREAFADGTLEDMSASVRLATEQCERYVQGQQRAVTNRLHVLVEVLHAHSDLCERVQKKIFSEHQKALSKATSSDAASNCRPKTKTLAINHGSLIVHPDTFSSSADVSLLARRSAFAYSCVRSETELAERYMQSLPSILLSYAHEEQKHHQQMSKIWHRLVVNESSRLS